MLLDKLFHFKLDLLDLGIQFGDRIKLLDTLGNLIVLQFMPADSFGRLDTISQYLDLFFTSLNLAVGHNLPFLALPDVLLEGK